MDHRGWRQTLMPSLKPTPMYLSQPRQIFHFGTLIITNYRFSLNKKGLPVWAALFRQ